MKLPELTPALKELDEALNHYRAIDTALTAAPLEEIQAGKQAIVQFPQAWKPFPSGVRGFPLRRFPYTILYLATDQEILIVAYAHQRRHPCYWQIASNGQMTAMPLSRRPASALTVIQGAPVDSGRLYRLDSTRTPRVRMPVEQQRRVSCRRLVRA